MSGVLWLWTHLSSGILLGTVACFLCLSLRPKFRFGAAIFAGFLVFLPTGLTDLSGLIVAHTEVLSVSTIVALLYQMAVHQSHKQQRKASRSGEAVGYWKDTQVTTLAAVIVIAGIPLYSSALGFFSFDVYAMGFYSGFTWAVLGLSLVFAVKGFWLPAYCLVAAAIAQGLKIADSPNLWNYLLDPWITIGSTFHLLVVASLAVMRRFQRRTTAKPEPAAAEQASRRRAA